MKAYTLFILCLVIAFACKTSSKSASSETFSKTFGEDFVVKNVLTQEAVIAKLKEGKEFEAQVEGKVESVCQAKGCWMNIVSDKKQDSEKVFVKFHNYGFFMPLDLAGSKIVMNGKAFIEETSVEELRHYAEDAGKSKEEIEKITQPKINYKFMATGVKVKG
jgi:hypothetical protein